MQRSLMQEIREKELGDIGNDQGGLLAWLLCRLIGILREVVGAKSQISTRIYRKKRGRGNK